MATCSLPPRQDEAENEVRKVLGGEKSGLISERWFDKWGEWGEWGEGTNKGCKANHSPPPTGGVVPPVSRQQHPWKATPHPVCSQGLGAEGGLLLSVLWDGVSLWPVRSRGREIPSTGQALLSNSQNIGGLSAPFQPQIQNTAPSGPPQRKLTPSHYPKGRSMSY